MPLIYTLDYITDDAEVVRQKAYDRALRAFTKSSDRAVAKLERSRTIADEVADLAYTEKAYRHSLKQAEQDYIDGRALSLSGLRPYHRDADITHDAEMFCLPHDGPDDYDAYDDFYNARWYGTYA